MIPTTNLVWNSQNSYKVEQSGEDDCAETCIHLTVFDQGQSPLNKVLYFAFWGLISCNHFILTNLYKQHSTTELNSFADRS